MTEANFFAPKPITSRDIDRAAKLSRAFRSYGKPSTDFAGTITNIKQANSMLELLHKDDGVELVLKEMKNTPDGRVDLSDWLWTSTRASFQKSSTTEKHESLVRGINSFIDDQNARRVKTYIDYQTSFPEQEAWIAGMKAESRWDTILRGKSSGS